MNGPTIIITGMSSVKVASLLDGAPATGVGVGTGIGVAVGSGTPTSVAVGTGPAGVSVGEGPTGVSVGEGPTGVSVGAGPAGVSVGAGPAGVFVGEGPAGVSVGAGKVSDGTIGTAAVSVGGTAVAVSDDAGVADGTPTNVESGVGVVVVVSSPNPDNGAAAPIGAAIPIINAAGVGVGVLDGTFKGAMIGGPPPQIFGGRQTLTLSESEAPLIDATSAVFALPQAPVDVTLA